MSYGGKEVSLPLLEANDEHLEKSSSALVSPDVPEGRLRSTVGQVDRKGPACDEEDLKEGQEWASDSGYPHLQELIDPYAF